MTDNKKEPKLLRKTLAAFKLVDAGIPPKEALETINLKTKLTPAAYSRFEAKYKKYSLTSPQIVNTARKQIKRILQGTPREVISERMTRNGEVVQVTEQVVPSDTNILSAAMMVYDRYEPTRDAQDSKGDTYNTYIDLSGYSNSRLPNNE